MAKLQTFQNLLGVSVIVGLILASVGTTLTLSPLAQSPTRVSGISTTESVPASRQEPGEILSNFIPLELVDENTADSGYSTQLIKLTDSKYVYKISMRSRDSAEYTHNFISFFNSNYSDLWVKITPKIPIRLVGVLSTSVGDGLSFFSLENEHEKEFSIEKGIKTDFEVKYDFDTRINFVSEIEFEIEILN